MSRKRVEHYQSTTKADDAARALGKSGGLASFPIVGIGASAGGLEAFTQLLKNLPLDTGMGFVLVQHLDPEHESALTHLLARTTSLPVHEITNKLPVQPNHVYVIPRDANLSIAQGVLQLQTRPKTRVPQRAIDSFFESLAQDQRERAIGVVLSGTASDGTLGLEAIKAEGGITIAQDDSAKYDSMPRSAIAAGCVDLVLSPAEIAKELARIAKHPYSTGGSSLATAHENDDTPLPSTDGNKKDGDAKRVRAEVARSDGNHHKSKAAQGAEDGFKKILLLLRNHSGVDFSLYKSTTIQRRVARRLVLNKQDTLEGYAVFLRKNATELDALYSDVLISVTSFFRNPDAFEALEREVFPKLLKQRGAGGGAPRNDEPIRVWVLGCSTGQEAYSIAMAFVESAEKAPRTRRLQVFATDLNDKLLDKARHGLYAKSLADDVTPERLRRFFIEEEGGYRVAKMLREMVVFARQNLINDPPFSRMDLISCRNLLIYLEPSLQKKALPTFHYALRPGGFLMLGASESIGGFTDLFEPLDKKQKIYARKSAPTPALHLPARKENAERALQPPQLPIVRTEALAGLRGELSAQREADRVVVGQLAPPAVLIDDALNVLQFRGPTGAYLEPPAGKASFDVLKMAREGLMLPLRAAINQAKKENKTVHKQNVRVRRNGETRTVKLHVIPLRNLRERCFLIVFEEAGKAGLAPARDDGSGAAKMPPLRGKQEKSRVGELESDLAETRDYLQSMQEQHEAANEELQAANEEVQSANEELQSINEELETSKEELESANEELTTVNEEMGSRNTELNRLNSDLVNLQTSTKLPILLLGRDLTIRRFSPAAAKQFELLAADVGRPIGNVRHGLVFNLHKKESAASQECSTDLEALITETIAAVREQECDVQDQDGRWYSLRVRPYLTLENKVDGAVLVLTDIDEMKRAGLAIAATRDYAQNTIATVREPLLVLDKDLRIESASRSFYRVFQVDPKATVGKLLYDLGNRQWDIPRLREMLEQVLARKTTIEDFQVEHEFESIGPKIMLLNARQMHDSERNSHRILLAIEDITERVRGEAERRAAALALDASEVRFRMVADNIDQLAWTCDATFGNVIWYNKRWLEFTGLSFEQMKGWDWSKVQHPDHVGRVVRGVGRSRDTGEPWEDTFPLRGREGKYRWFLSRAVPIRDAGGKIVTWFGTNTDVTEQREAEEATALSEHRYRRLFEAAHDGILLLNVKDRRITDVNPFMLDLLDFPREHFIGKELWEIGVFRDKAESQQAMEKLHESGILRYDDKPLVDRNGRHIPVEMLANIYQEDHHPVIQCNIRDISERKRFEDEREAHLMNEQLLRMEAENANRSKDMFLATLSHEMRTPLNAIVGWMSILRGGKCEDKDFKEGLEVIDRNTKAQVQLIEDVLDVSRIVSGKLRLEIRPCDLADVIKAGVDVVRAAAEARGIALEVRIDPEVSRASCDAARIQQVVWNLVSNAIKFTPKGGTVRVTLARDHSSWRIQVADSGQGISPELLPYVFERFRQADSSTRRRFGGLGLGLSIVKHLVEMHGGTVDAHSAGDGKGATLTVRLPIRAVRIDESGENPEPAVEGDSQHAHASDLPLVRLDGLRLLVVDDEADARRLLVKVLDNAGAVVVAASSAAEALEAIDRVRPEILVSDIGMPDQDGFDLIRQVRQRGHHPKDLPAVALTAFVHKDDQRQALLAGFQVHVPKPVDPHDLTAVIASLAGRTGTPRVD